MFQLVGTGINAYHSTIAIGIIQLFGSIPWHDIDRQDRQTTSRHHLELVLLLLHGSLGGDAVPEGGGRGGVGGLGGGLLAGGLHRGLQLLRAGTRAVGADWRAAVG
ncbi:unnamed protein product [Sphagnum tenellum]